MSDTRLPTAGSSLNHTLWQALGSLGAGQKKLIARSSDRYVNSPLGQSQRSNPTAYSYIRDDQGGLVEEKIGGSTRYYYLFDGLGSVIGLTDSTGALAATYTYAPTAARSRPPAARPTPSGSPARTSSPASACTTWGSATTTRSLVAGRSRTPRTSPGT